MGLIYLADTNIISEMMRPQPDVSVKTAWQAYQHQVAISSITWHELLTGTYRLPQSKRRTAFESFLFEYLEKQLTILPYTQEAASWHALERARLMQVGKIPSFPDGQIAAVAAVNNLVIVTGNVADFTHFADLKVENWRLRPMQRNNDPQITLIDADFSDLSA